MTTSAYYPYRSEAARDRCFSYLEAIAARKWPIASEERWVPTRYGDTFVRISGPAGAPPLVLLHGAGGTSLMWARNVQALSTAFRTFAVDQIGDFGCSLGATPMPRIADYVGWMDDLFDRLQLDTGINLVGLSYGGGLAAQYALRYPSRLGKVVLLAPAATVLRISPRFYVRLFALPFARGKAMENLMRWLFVDTAARYPNWMEDVLDMFRVNMASMQRPWPPFPPVLSDEQWRNLAVPMLVLVGEHEKIYSPDKAVRRLTRVAPTVTAEIVPGADHDVAEAQPDIVNRRILDFLGAPAGARAASAR